MGAGSLVGAPTTFLMQKMFQPKPSAASVGSRPDATPLPDPYGKLSSIYGNLSGANASASSFVNSELAGRLSPATMEAIQDYSSRMGMSQTGTTGAPFNIYGGAKTLGLQTENLQRQGVSDFNALSSNMKNTQTLSDQLEAWIKTYNEQIGHAADPVEAAKFAIKMANINQVANGVGEGFTSLGDTAMMGFGGGMGGMGGVAGGGTGMSSTSGSWVMPK